MITVGAFLIGVAVGMALLAICLAWDSADRGREPLGVRHDRLDAEARVATYDATVVPRPRPRGEA